MCETPPNFDTYNLVTEAKILKAKSPKKCLGIPWAHESTGELASGPAVPQAEKWRRRHF